MMVFVLGNHGQSVKWKSIFFDFRWNDLLVLDLDQVFWGIHFSVFIFFIFLVLENRPILGLMTIWLSAATLFNSVKYNYITFFKKKLNLQVFLNTQFLKVLFRHFDTWEAFDFNKKNVDCNELFHNEIKAERVKH